LKLAFNSPEAEYGTDNHDTQMLGELINAYQRLRQAMSYKRDAGLSRKATKRTTIL
jgi:hypothetical protein